jgi:hypothetical protein
MQDHLGKPCFPCPKPCIPLSKTFLEYVFTPEVNSFDTTVEKNKNLIEFIHNEHVYWQQYKGKRIHQGFYETMLHKLGICERHTECTLREKKLDKKNARAKAKGGFNPRWGNLRKNHMHM